MALGQLVSTSSLGSRCVIFSMVSLVTMMVLHCLSLWFLQLNTEHRQLLERKFSSSREGVLLIIVRCVHLAISGGKGKATIVKRLKYRSYHSIGRTGLICSLLLFSSCQSKIVVSKAPPQIQAREPQQEIKELEQHIRKGQQQEALQIWKRLDFDKYQDSNEQQNFNYLRSRLFSSRMLQDERAEWANSQVSTLAFDYDDLWIGTWMGGVARYSIPLGKFKILSPNRRTLEPTVVYHIRPTAYYVWILANDGIKRYDKRLASWSSYNPIGFSGKPTDMITNQRGEILIATIDSGLWRLSNGSAWRIEGVAGDNITVLSRSKRYDVLFGTVDRGLFSYQNGVINSITGIFPNLKLTANITSIIDDGQSIWLGTSGQGLLSWRYLDERLRRYDANSGILSDNWVEDLLILNNQLFVVTMRGGFISFDQKKQRWFDWNAESGLMSDTITALAANQQQLYYGTLGSGIVRLDWMSYVENN